MASAAMLAQAPPKANSRWESISLLQADKAKTLKAPEPDKGEALVMRAEKLLILDPSGWFPYFDSVYQGGGLTGGLGYRKFYGDNTFWEVKGLYSVLNYKLIEGGTYSRGHFNKKLNLGARLGWRDATQVDFYGVGQDSKEENKTNFRFKETYADGIADFRPRPWLPIKGTLSFENWNTMEGTGSSPSIEEGFTPATAPGLGADTRYIHSKVSAGVDWRQSPGYSRRGGLYEVTFHDYNHTSGGLYSFQKLDGEVVQHLPLLRETWVLSARGRVETTLNDNDNIPYFLLPSLGSGSTLRA
ncbi:MAG TPA: hypothetical protein VF414_12200, partial [Thermoanaerobaculia bacterium]